MGVKTIDIRCQQFTPIEISNKMLDMLEYRENVYGRKIIENSCGEGNILCLVVERYIKDAIKNRLTNDQIINGLEQDIYGAEVVKETYLKCIQNLDAIALQYNLINVRWNIVNRDILKLPFNEKFDFVIGNPPYISYGNLDKEDRAFIKERFRSCKKGKPDYCYAFIESAIDCLCNGGKLVYLVPNSIFKNVFADNLRKIISPHVIKIYDYPNCKLFKEALTSSAIMVIQKDGNINNLEYINKNNNSHIIIPKTRLGDKWTFNVFEQFDDEKIVRFDTCFKAAITIATQRNSVYVLSEQQMKERKIERGILRKAISPRNQLNQKKEFIVFPYRIKKHKLIHLSEEELKNKYPQAYHYLSENKKELKKRRADKTAMWYEYGRTQAIHNMNRKKLLVSTVITHKVKVYELTEREVPYSGIYIIATDNLELDIAKRVLESSEFYEYVKQIGTPASGSSLRITADDINKYKFRMGEFINE